MRLIFFLLLCLSSQTLYSNAWIDIEDINEYKLDLLLLNQACNSEITFGSEFPLIAGRLFSKLEKISSKNKECIEEIQAFINKINQKTFYRKQEKIIFQTKSDNFYLQSLSKRKYQEASVSYVIKDNFAKFGYKLELHKYKNNKEIEIYESYISFLTKNHQISIGQFSKWWSPSKETSLILSNSSIPMPGIAISNFKSISLEKVPIFSYLGDFDYSIFLNRFESNREIPNAYLFGQRFSFTINKNIDLSLLRIAQFGGEGRAVTIDTLKSILSGKDTQNSNIKIEDESGNQLAGIDFTIHLYKNKTGFINLYGQYLGEDGLDPIIDDGWIGAIFPSKRFGQFGMSYQSKAITNPYSIYFEKIDTETDTPNIVYNHHIYTDGLNYKSIPIGANIGGDSEILVFAFEKHTNKNFIYEIKYRDIFLNKNNSNKNRWSNHSFKVNEVNLKLKKIISKKLSFDISLIARDTQEAWIQDFNFFINIEYIL